MSMHLKLIRLIQSNEVNDISICENADDPGNVMYTVIDVKDHRVVRDFLSSWETMETPPAERKMSYFSDGGKNRILFPFVRERPLKDFYMGRVLSVGECEEICRNLIMACMTSDLPVQVLYLALTQGQVHLSADLSVYLSYAYDLSEFDLNIREADCVQACAELVRDILEAKAKQKAESYVLLKKKTFRHTYKKFTELYKDVEIAGVQKRRRNIRAAIIYWFEDNKDRLFRILIVVVTMLVVFTLLTLITNAIFGDVPWLRLFIRSFEMIGLESMLQ